VKVEGELTEMTMCEKNHEPLSLRFSHLLAKGGAVEWLQKLESTKEVFRYTEQGTISKGLGCKEARAKVPHAGAVIVEFCTRRYYCLAKNRVNEDVPPQ